MFSQEVVRHWSQHQDQLKQVATVSRLGIVSDFDGTLSDFVNEPDEARITPENANALERLADCVTVVALLSGRSAEDLYTCFKHPSLVYYGNHGLDYWHEHTLYIAPQVRQWIDPLAALLNEFGTSTEPGVMIENKGVTASIHYRNTLDPLSTRFHLEQQLTPLVNKYGFLLNEGRLVWEIKPPVVLNKGTALQALIEDYHLNGVVFLGDDITDLTAMTALRSWLSAHTADPLPPVGLSVGVIHPEGTSPAIYDSCDITANGPHDVATLLHWLADHSPQSNKDKHQEQLAPHG